MKSFFKFFFALLVGVGIGLLVGTLGVIIFTDISPADFWANMASAKLADMALAVAVGTLALFVSVAIIVTVHEAGHLVGGLLSGYRFVSFRIFNFVIARVNGRICIKRFAVAGTGGQCLLTPPDRSLEDIPVILYNASGVLANILLLLIALPFLWMGMNPFLHEALIIFCLTDGFLILLNGIPMKLGGMGNDAYNMLMLGKHPASKEALMIQLRSNAEIQNGTRPKDMPAGWFEYNDDIDYKNPLEVSIPLMHASRLLDEMEWEAAYEEFDELYARKKDLIGLYVYEVSCELAFCAMVTGRSDRALELLTPELRKYIDTYSKVMSSKRRMQCAMALYLDGDRDRAMDIFNQMNAAKDSYLLQGEVASDLAIMEKILE